MVHGTSYRLDYFQSGPKRVTPFCVRNAKRRILFRRQTGQPHDGYRFVTAELCFSVYTDET